MFQDLSVVTSSLSDQRKEAKIRNKWERGQTLKPEESWERKKEGGYARGMSAS